MIRQATAKDIPIILDLYEKGLRELGETEILESLLLQKVVNSFHLAPCFLLVIDDNVVGIAGFTVVTTSHNGVASLADYMFYVSPEHRNIKNLSELINAAKDFATDKNISIRIESLANNDEDLRKRLFTMHGFRVLSVTGVYNE